MTGTVCVLSAVEIGGTRYGTANTVCVAGPVSSVSK